MRGLQAEPISAQVDAYIGWMAEFDPAFVMLAAPKSYVQQGGHTLDIALSGVDGEELTQQRLREQDWAVQNRQCWKCDLDKYFPGGPIEGGASFRHRIAMTLVLVLFAGIAVGTIFGSLARRMCKCCCHSASRTCKAAVQQSSGLLWR